MASGNERVDEGRGAERRRRRSGCLADALRLQLEACCEDEGLATIVVSDELGLCVAHAGGNGSHDELAARLPMLADTIGRTDADAAAGHGGDPRGDHDDGLEPPAASLALATFSAAGAKLHACAVKDPGAPANTSTNGTEVLARVANGFTRLLSR
jgi:hypothetical protein